MNMKISPPNMFIISIGIQYLRIPPKNIDMRVEEANANVDEINVKKCFLVCVEHKNVMICVLSPSSAKNIVINVNINTL